MRADDATLTGALKELRDNWSTEVDAILEGRYSFWLRSGISRERLPDLKGLLREKVLLPLQLKVGGLNPACPFRRVLDEIIGLTKVKGIDPTTPVHLWNGGDLIRTGRCYHSPRQARLEGGSREIRRLGHYGHAGSGRKTGEADHVTNSGWTSDAGARFCS